MGIPSYYKRLIDRYPKLVQKRVDGMQSDVLLMDFNCLIYQCVRGDTIPQYSEETRLTWEAAVLEAVKSYTVKVWNTAGRPSKVFIGVDGVVPMAKIRQQRLRRFKSRWLAAMELEVSVRKPGEEVWDTNAITPGTEFMEKLARALKSLAAARPGWVVSAADEPGEGEQKLMAWVRGHAKELIDKKVVVYGLDADLIVLSLIGVAREVPGVAGWKLLRELTEFQGGKAEGGVFGTLDVVELLSILRPPGMSAAEYMLEYTCGMSFLGNDFLPHSLSVKMRDGGHDIMCQALSNLHSAGYRLVRGDQVQRDGCLELIREWAVQEERSIDASFEHKYMMRAQPPRNDRERLMRSTENLPLTWADENHIWRMGRGFVNEWQDIYRGKWLHDAPSDQVCGEYMSGLQWIVDYYLGKPVSYSWYFPWNVPPLWDDLVQAFSSEDALIAAPPPSTPVTPQEQLAMVLPMGSWKLVRDPKYKMLPFKAPVYWPRSFSFFSVGRRWLWECEVEIPILTAARMRQLL